MSLVVLVLALACGEDVDLNENDAANAGGAFISGNIKPDSACGYSPDGPQTQSGLFDIAPGGSSDLIGGDETQNCDQPYALFLLVESQGDELALFQQAEVTLLSASSDKIAFAGEGTTLPNPLELTVAGRVDGETGQGIVQVNAIPPHYAPQLQSFIDDEIVIEVSLEGRTISGRAIGTQSFRIPVRICYGCLTLCGSAIEDQMLVPDDVIGDECGDNAGADGRVCIDTDC